MPDNRQNRYSSSDEWQYQRSYRGAEQRRTTGSSLPRNTGRSSAQDASQYSRARYASNRAPSRSQARQASSGANARSASNGSGPAGKAAAKSTGAVKWVIAAIAAIIVIVLMAVVVRSCASSDDGNNDASQSPPTPGAAAAQNDGTVVLTLFGDEDTLVLVGEEYIEPGAQAFDRNEGQIEDNLQISGAVDTSTPGDYEVTYTVQNSAGMTATRTRTVHVVESMDVDDDGIPVMMYHWIYDGDTSPDPDDPNWLSASKLEAQLQWLDENDYYFPSHREIRAYVEGTHSLPKKSVVLTFDDGEEGFMRYAIPLFNKYKIPATSYVVGDDPNTPARVREYANDYVSFESHSYGMHNGGSTDIGRGGMIYDMSYDDVVADAQIMEEMLGDSPSMAYPFGDVSDVAPDALRDAGLLCAYTVNYGNVNKGDDPMRLNRVRVFGESSLDGWVYQVETGE